MRDRGDFVNHKTCGGERVVVIHCGELYNLDFRQSIICFRVAGRWETAVTSQSCRARSIFQVWYPRWPAIFTPRRKDSMVEIRCQ